MKHRTTRLAALLLAIFIGFALQSCFLRGDPRRNCNHPQHGNYVKEQRMKKTGF